MSNRPEKQKFLCIVDFSYLRYFSIFSAVRDFQQDHEDEASLWIKPVEECDQDNLPDLLGCATFRRILKNVFMKKLEQVENVVKQNFQDQIDSVDQIDTIFACDDKLKRNFRLDLYPQYKANRLVVKRQYKLSTLKDYVRNVLCTELGLEENYGYRFITVDGAEGDDVIATVLMKFKDSYSGSVLIASDHDFLQIDGVREFDLFGKEAKRELGKEEVSAEDFLLGKILMGDKSDNIKQVFYKCGPKTALRLTKDKAALRNMLKEDQESASRFKLNKKIISFAEIPKELSDRIVKAVNESLYAEDVLNKRTDFRSQML